MKRDLELLAIEIGLLNLKMSLDYALAGITVSPAQAEPPTPLIADCSATSDIAQDTAEKVEALV